MALQRMDIGPQQVVIHSTGTLCISNEELAASHAFAQVVQAYVDYLRKQASVLLEAIPLRLDGKEGVSRLVQLLNALARSPIEEIAAPGAVSAAQGDTVYDFLSNNERIVAASLVIL
jgi:hypothetical protein